VIAAASPTTVAEGKEPRIAEVAWKQQVLWRGVRRRGKVACSASCLYFELCSNRSRQAKLSCRQLRQPPTKNTIFLGRTDHTPSSLPSSEVRCSSVLLRRVGDSDTEISNKYCVVRHRGCICKCKKQLSASQGPLHTARRRSLSTEDILSSARIKT
jgi:hypothetical protein